MPKNLLVIFEMADGTLRCTCGGRTGKTDGDVCPHIRALQETGVDEDGRPNKDVA